MLFNSFTFALFLFIVFGLYWGVFNRKNVTARNCFLLAASYVFYGWWNWKCLLLIVLTSLCSWLGALFTNASEDDPDSWFSRVGSKLKPKAWLVLNLVLNLGILAVFKYYDFFVDSFLDVCSAAGISFKNVRSLNIILPVGISFYTFQALGYCIDVYRKNLKPVKDPVQYFAFVSFFPQLVAGPIERAANLLPQFETLKKPDFEAFRSACMLMLWGFFKKMMIADRLAVMVEGCYSSIGTASGLPMLMAAVFFAFQLYLDFSAYSDIARGCARLFGFELMVNFDRPYLSSSFSKFWKRWHISLSSWFMDYLYIPLGGNRKGKWRKMLNLLIVFAVSGLWHGASWNFVIWGISNAAFIILLDPVLKLLKGENVLVHAVKSVFIFAMYALSLIFFRADGFEEAVSVFASLGFGNASAITNFGLNAAELAVSAILLLILAIQEIAFEWKGDRIESFFYNKLPGIVRWLVYVAMILSIIYLGQYGSGNEHSFIYFQF